MTDPAETPSPDTVGELLDAAKAVVLDAWTDRYSRLHGHPSVTKLEAAISKAEASRGQGSSLRDTQPATETDVVAPWKSTPVGQFAPWMTPSQRPAYEDTPFRHWVMVEGFCDHHGSIWARSQIGEAVIRRDNDEDCYQGYRRSDIEEIERRGDMDQGTGIVTFWTPWGNFPPVPSSQNPPSDQEPSHD